MSSNAENSFQLEMGTISKLLDICGYENSRLSVETKPNLLGRSIFGHGFGAFRDGVFGELTWESEADCGLNFSGAQGGSLVVADEFAGLNRDALEGIVDEGVHDGHGSLGDTSVGVANAARPALSPTLPTSTKC
jgi:hypothetical protein